MGKGVIELVEGMITVRKWKIPAEGKKPIEALGQGWDQKAERILQEMRMVTGGWTTEKPSGQYHGFALMN